ncbi:MULTISPECIES: DUF5302 domain-containing protein [Streptomyces]|uniref:DUF5302 domain-containing protein n=1 Tax=Streptomyces silvisoli TaxID=3034235 RepID=A0ABT5ZED4_9ACTN|nr:MULTISPECIES: DUF5302 domain-containing protein [Streptomyces]MDF3287965.1 DUF5302 domain-containing protein [Streptomyces silvisoli]
MAAETQPHEVPEPADSESPSLAPGDDGQYDLKRKFQEALARKRGQQAGAGTGSAGPDSSKVHGAQGPAARQRSFRRKSGG